MGRRSLAAASARLLLCRHLLLRRLTAAHARFRCHLNSSGRTWETTKLLRRVLAKDTVHVASDGLPLLRSFRSSAVNLLLK